MFKFIHCADVHLDSPTAGLELRDGGQAARIPDATRRAFQNMVDLAIREKVAFVLIAGDLFDSDLQSFKTGMFFCEQMDRLKRHGIDVVAIAGNHDAVGRLTTTLSLPSNVKFLASDRPESHTLSSVPVVVHGQSFASSVVKESLVAGGKYPRAADGMFNVGLLHTAMEYVGKHAAYAPCRLDDLRGYGYDYWALGHIHAREIVCNLPWVVYPGNLQGRDVGEPGEKGCYLVTVKDRRADPRFQAVDVMRWERCEVKAPDAADEDEALAAVCEQVDTVAAQHGGLPVAMRVHLETSPAAARRLLEASNRAVIMVRAALVSRGAKPVTVDKVKVTSVVRPGTRVALPDTGPIRELVELIAELGADDAKLADLARVLDPLRQKLASEIRNPRMFFPGDPGWLRELLAETDTYLVSRLSNEGEEL